MTRLQISPDLSLDVADQGDGPLVILIAGGMMDMDQWELVADALSDAYRVVRYDQRGIGESDQPTEGYTVDQFAEDAVNLIKALDSGPAVLIGNSLGGTVALGAAFLEPGLVRGIVTCATNAGSTGPPTPPETMQHMMRGAQLPVPQAAAAMMDILFATDFIDEHPHMLDEAVEKRSKGAPMIATLGPLQSVLTFDPIERLKTLNIPMLVLHGEEDVLVPPDHAQLLAEAAGTEPILIPNAGHALVVEQSDAVAQNLTTFLSELNE
ncbi:MAG: alpha/beta hydrolase [Chloroflexi bacterium]|nr:alpha/beta hydrolase [Chloroflexota bacterium]MYJ91822.1 alpha/beta hydrolase [Chloroflexota bacterium]